MEGKTEEEKEIEERKRKIKKFLLNKKTLFVLIGLLVLLILAWNIRTSNVAYLKDITTGEDTLGPDLDPFLFLRYAKYIVEHGKLMAHDSMRYAPLGWDTIGETKLLPYMIAYFHIILSKFKDVSVEYSAVIFPVFMFLLTLIAFFLFVRKVFENKKGKNIIALISAAFLIVSPSLLPRTVAGIPEKESVAFFFMFLSFYFFLSAWKSEKLKKALIFAFLAGISAACMQLIWGGVRYVYMIIAFSVFLYFIFGKVNRKQILIYSVWIFFSFFLTILFSNATLMGIINSPTSSGISFAVFSLLLVDFFVFNTKIRNFNLIQKMRKKIPDKVISILFWIVFGVIFSTLFFGSSFVIKFVGQIFSSLIRPYESRISFTVAENRQPFFVDWRDNFGPIIKGMPIFFWLFFIGSIFLFYEAIKKIGEKEKYILTFSYVIFLFALIFSRYASGGIMNGTSNISKIVYFSGFLLIASSFSYLYYNYYKKERLREFRKINSSYVFLLAFFIVSLIGARSAIRLIMVLSIPASALVGYLCVVIVEKAKKSRDEILKLVLWVIAIFIVISILYSFYSNYQLTLNGARNMRPSSYTQQWQKAMAWVRDNTEEDAVFAHWWDYGYWIQTMGNRATVLDGGNAIAYWNHLLGRHVLTGKSEREALEFLYAHNASYLLIDSTEIGKYGAYSSIGSDENYDRYSLMPTFTEDEKNLQETKEEIIHLYKGSMWLDRDYRFQQNSNQIFLPANQVGIGGVFFIESKGGEIKQPQAVFVYQGRQVNIPMRYVYYNNKLYDFKEGYQGCLYFIPAMVSQEGRSFIKNSGSALFITEKSMEALWVKLYLFDEGENFELVHKQDSLIVEELRKGGFGAGDFILYYGIQGPIKIWKINYPSDISFKEQYLETYYPEEIMIAKNV